MVSADHLMDASPENVIGIVTALTVLLGAIATAAVKIGGCIEVLRVHTVRTRATAELVSRQMGDDTEAIQQEIARVRELLYQMHEINQERDNNTDNRINELVRRVGRIEERTYR